MFVRLLNEGTDAWRPTIAEYIGPSTVRLIATPTYESYDEEWEFVPGAIVECAERTFQDGASGQVAVRQVHSDKDA